MMKNNAISNIENQLNYNNAITIIFKKMVDFSSALEQDRVSKILVFVILLFNFIFIFAHCARYFAVLLGTSGDFFLIQHFSLFRIDQDGSYAEWFVYLQTAVCVVLLLGVFRATRQPVYAVWSLIFLFVVADDSLMIHERAGNYLVRTFGIPALPGLRPDDSGELLVWGMVGAVLLGILWWGFARSGRSARAASGVLAMTFAALVFFAAVVDMLHVALADPGTAVYALLSVIEDGGEMLSIGLACTLALLLYRHPALAG